MTCPDKFLFGQSKDEKKTIYDDEINFTRKHSERNRKDHSGYFYLLNKIYKPRKLGAPVPTKPVCFDCDGITNPIGKWVDVKLQPVAQSMRTYIKYSFEFKRLIEEHGPLSPRVQIFTFDEESMYTSIPTDYTICRDSQQVLVS